MGLFEWDYKKVPKRAFKVTATEWNRFTDKINEALGKNELPTESFDTEQRRNLFTHTIFNKVRNALNTFQLPLPLPPLVASGAAILAEYFDMLKNYLNNAENSYLADELLLSQMRFKQYEPIPVPYDDTTVEYEYADIITEIFAIETEYSDRVSIETVGKSYNNFEQYAMHISDDGQKPIIGLSLGIHGNEIAVHRSTLDFVRFLLEASDGEAFEILDKFTLLILPNVNPDGMYGLDGSSANQFRRNGRGIDLNRNWPYFWDATISDDKGASAASEPETQNIINYMTTDITSRIIYWYDVHGWTSRTTWGHLTENIFHDTNTRKLQRYILNYMNSLISQRDYSTFTIVDDYPILTEYFSNKKPYIYTWIRNRARKDAFCGIFEYPMTENDGLCNAFFMDLLWGSCLGVLDYYTATRKKGVLCNEALLPLNQNYNLDSWSDANKRPNFYRYSGLDLAHKTDEAINEKYVETFRNGFTSWFYEVAYGAYVLVRNNNNDDAFYIIGGRGIAGSRSGVRRENLISKLSSALPSLPLILLSPAACTDGQYIYVSGGFSGGDYQTAIYRIDLSNISLGWSLWGNMSIGLQRHTMEFWNGKLLIIGGYDGITYKNNILSIDVLTKTEVELGTFTTSRGWHTSMIRGDTLYVVGGWSGASARDNVRVVDLSLLPNDNLFDDYLEQGTISTTTGADSSSTSRVRTGYISIQEGKTYTKTTSSDYVSFSLHFYDASFNWLGQGDTAPSSAVYTRFAIRRSDNADFGIDEINLIGISILAVTERTITLPEARRRHSMAVDEDNGIAYICLGDDGIDIKSTVWSLDLSTETVVNINYTLDDTEHEDGIIDTVPEPLKSGSQAYWNPLDEELCIIGGEDGTTYYDTVYILDMSDNIMSLRGSLESRWGFIRSNQVFNGTTGDKFSLNMTIRNGSVQGINDLRNPYVRLTILTGPLSSVIRRIRTQYTVPPIDGFAKLGISFELQEGETEFRAYIRHYSNTTRTHVKDFQVFNTNTYGVIVPDGGLSAVLYDKELLGSTSAEGVFSPLFGSQLTVDQTILTLQTEAGSTINNIQLVFVSTPVANKTLKTGEFRIKWTKDAITNDVLLTDEPELNHARFYSNYRADEVHWRCRQVGDNIEFDLWTYNIQGQYVISNETITLDKIVLDESNCIHYVI
jgi:hypothetical protein